MDSRLCRARTVDALAGEREDELRPLHDEQVCVLMQRLTPHCEHYGDDEGMALR